MPKILLLGKDGQVGWELQRSLAAIGEVIATGRTELDLTDLAGLRRFVRQETSTLIVNAAAYTDVDRVEIEQELAQAVNTQAPGILAEEAARSGGFFFHLSTDYVFDGRKGSPYLEQDEPNPINHYGLTKLDGEKAIQEVDGASWILRTSWVYSRRRPCFLTSVLEWARGQQTIYIADDQFGSPTWCRSLAEAITQAADEIITHGSKWAKARAGVYHVACTGSPSRFELARKILDLEPYPAGDGAARILPAKSVDFVTAAVRPSYTALDCRRFQTTFGVSLPGWELALEEALSNPNP